MSKLVKTMIIPDLITYGIKLLQQGCNASVVLHKMFILMLHSSEQFLDFHSVNQLLNFRN